MICLTVIESDPQRRKTIRGWIVSYTIRQDCDLETLWIADKTPAAAVKKYASSTQIALISLDDERGEDCGRLLYENNPDCRILYYRSAPCNLSPLLSSRPIHFFLWSEGGEAFQEAFDFIYREVEFALTTFRYETKSRMYLLAKRNILYFQSDLRYVDIHTVREEKHRVPAKLNDLEVMAGNPFVRIHRSYLVNAKHVLWIDKKARSVILSNGEQLPISDAQYENACEKMRCVK